MTRCPDMFIELHAASAFSFLEGASVPEEMAAVCQEQGVAAMALLDRDGLYGSPRFHYAMKKAGMRAHIGSEITFNRIIRSSDHRVIRKAGLRRINDPMTRSPDDPIVRLPLLAANRRGYQNLCHLITRMKARGPKDAPPEVIAANEEDLQQHADGLICLTGGDHGPLAQALETGGMAAAKDEADRLVRIFGRENVYVELQRHYLRDEEARNHALIDLAASLNLPLLATNAPRHARPEQRQLADVFTCLANHRILATAGRLLARNNERHIKPPQEMAQLFADLPDAIANTLELSSRLEFTLEDLGYEFPRYPVPDGETMMSFLRKRTDEGFQSRYGRKPRDLRQRARRQIERELALIGKLKLEGYFLIVWDIVRYCRDENILVQGRGSAANSAVCYSLGITAVDPVGMDLLFERFLSEERGEWPDIDLDLPSGDQREKAIQYVYKRYGERGAAMTANVITYRGRLAAREMGKVLGFDNQTIDRLGALVGTWEYRAPEDTLQNQFRLAGFDLRHPRMRKFLELCLAVQDLPRHLGQHSGGMVICQGQLDSVVPLEPATMPGRVVVQWDKEDCADLGIIKVDLLGLGMMAVLEDSIQLIRDHYQEEVDLAHVPADDPKIYATLQKADTVGMFQIESRAQMSCLPRLRPKNFYDIVIQIAIIRPGPIVGKMVNPFLERRQGRQQVEYAHPSLEPVLERTLGVPLFQEQLLRMAMITAGFSGGEAEELRRAMGFKRSEKRMHDIESKLRAGMTRNGITPQSQEEIIQQITSFALYGFPESHSASFALLAYASAYLKVHYLAAFTAALLNNQPMGFYHPSTIVKDAQRHGLKMLPADVTKSDWNCTIEQIDSPWRHGDTEENTSSVRFAMSDGQNQFTITRAIENQKSKIENTSVPPCLRGHFAVRLGLRYVRGLREEAARALLREREKRGFDSITDLARRVPELRKDELTMLAKVGALNAVGNIDDCNTGLRANRQSSILNRQFHRRDALWQVAKAAQPVGELLRDIPEPDMASPLERMNTEERLVADYAGTGVTIGAHPMAYQRAELRKKGVLTAIELETTPNGKWVKAAGCVIARQRPGTAHGFVFLSLEDETGIANAILTPDLFEKYRIELVSVRFMLVEGVLQHQDNVISVRAKKISRLDFTAAQTSSHDFH